MTPGFVSTSTEQSAMVMKTTLSDERENNPLSHVLPFVLALTFDVRRRVIGIYGDWAWDWG